MTRKMTTTKVTNNNGDADKSEFHRAKNLAAKLVARTLRQHAELHGPLLYLFERHGLVRSGAARLPHAPPGQVRRWL